MKTSTQKLTQTVDQIIRRCAPKAGDSVAKLQADAEHLASVRAKIQAMLAAIRESK